MLISNCIVIRLLSGPAGFIVTVHIANREEGVACMQMLFDKFAVCLNEMCCIQFDLNLSEPLQNILVDHNLKFQYLFTF